MSLSCVEVDRFSVGGFGDLRLKKRGRGVIKRLWPILAHAFLNLAVGRGVGRLGLAVSCAILLATEPENGFRAGIFWPFRIQARLFWAARRCGKLDLVRLAGAAFWVGFSCILFLLLMRPAESLLALLILPCGTAASRSRRTMQSGLWQKKNRRNG
jgi:hypothetical protein